MPRQPDNISMSFKISADQKKEEDGTRPGLAPHASRPSSETASLLDPRQGNQNPGIAFEMPLPQLERGPPGKKLTSHSNVEPVTTAALLELVGFGL